MFAGTALLCHIRIRQGTCTTAKYLAFVDRAHTSHLLCSLCFKSEQCKQHETFAISCRSIASALVFSTLQERVFNIPGFEYGGWMTFLTYLMYATCGWLEAVVTRDLNRRAPLRVSVVCLLNDPAPHAWPHVCRQQQQATQHCTAQSVFTVQQQAQRSMHVSVHFLTFTCDVAHE